MNDERYLKSKNESGGNRRVEAPKLELTPEQASIALIYLKLGLALNDLLNKYGLIESFAPRYEAPGSQRLSTQDIYRELIQNHPDIIDNMLNTAEHINFDIGRDKKHWESVVSSALRIADAQSGFFWSAEEWQTLSNKAGLSVSELAELLPGRSPGAVEAALTRFNSPAIGERESILWSANELQILIDNSSSLTSAQLTHLLPGRSYSAISNMRSELGLPSTEKPWQEAEDAVLRKGFEEGLTDKQISEGMGDRTEMAVSLRRQDIGILRDNWSPEKNAELAALVQQNLSDDEMAKQLGIDKRTLGMRLRLAGLRETALNHEEIERIFVLGREGYRIFEIAQILGVTDKVVDRYVREANLSAVTLNRWSEVDAQALVNGCEQHMPDEDTAAYLNRPVWQIKYYKFMTFGLKYLDDYERSLWWEWEYEGAWQPFAKYLRDEVKMSYVEMNKQFNFIPDSAEIGRSIRRYLESDGNFGKKPFTHLKAAEAMELYEQGYSIEETAKMIGRGHGNVGDMVKAMFEGNRNRKRKK